MHNTTAVVSFTETARNARSRTMIAWKALPSPGLQCQGGEALCCYRGAVERCASATRSEIAQPRCVWPIKTNLRLSPNYFKIDQICRTRYHHCRAKAAALTTPHLRGRSPDLAAALRLQKLNCSHVASRAWHAAE